MKKKMMYDSEWVEIGDLWFCSTPMVSGIFCGVTLEQLEDLEYMKTIGMED